MSITNLTYPLEKRYAGLMGQVDNLEQRIREAERLYGAIPEMRAEIAKRHDQMVHIVGTIRGFDPSWDPKNVRPRKPHAYNLPFKYGQCTVLACEILREKGRWTTIKELVVEVLRREGIKYEIPLYIATAANVGAGFRRRLKLGEIECDRSYTPCRWRLRSENPKSSVK